VEVLWKKEAALILPCCSPASAQRRHAEGSAAASLRRLRKCRTPCSNGGSDAIQRNDSLTAPIPGPWYCPHSGRLAPSIPVLFGRGPIRAGPESAELGPARGSTSGNCGAGGSMFNCQLQHGSYA
jgi:hypothetical protein